VGSEQKYIEATGNKGSAKVRLEHGILEVVRQKINSGLKVLVVLDKMEKCRDLYNMIKTQEVSLGEGFVLDTSKT